MLTMMMKYAVPAALILQSCSASKSCSASNKKSAAHRQAIAKHIKNISLQQQQQRAIKRQNAIAQRQARVNRRRKIRFPAQPKLKYVQVDVFEEGGEFAIPRRVGDNGLLGGRRFRDIKIKNQKAKFSLEKYGKQAVSYGEIINTLEKSMKRHIEDTEKMFSGTRKRLTSEFHVTSWSKAQDMELEYDENVSGVIFYICIFLKGRPKGSKGAVVSQVPPQGPQTNGGSAIGGAHGGAHMRAPSVGGSSTTGSTTGSVGTYTSGTSTGTSTRTNFTGGPGSTGSSGTSTNANGRGRTLQMYCCPDCDSFATTSEGHRFQDVNNYRIAYPNSDEDRFCHDCYQKDKITKCDLIPLNGPRLPIGQVERVDLLAKAYGYISSHQNQKCGWFMDALGTDHLRDQVLAEWDRQHEQERERQEEKEAQRRRDQLANGLGGHLAGRKELLSALSR